MLECLVAMFLAVVVVAVFGLIVELVATVKEYLA